MKLKLKQITTLVCFAALCVLSPRAFAQTNGALAKNKPKTEPPGGNRFLFIVDTSASMKSAADDMLQAVGEIVDSSASGQLHRGDTLGVWTFNAQLYPGVLPLQKWTPEDKKEIALRTAGFLKQQRYGKESRLTAALEGMYAVIKGSDIITIFLISNGQSPIQGTPFDDQINALYAENLREMKKNRKPIVTVLQAKRGKIIKYTVNALPWPVVIPEVPIPIKTAETAVATAPEATATETAPPAPKPTPALAPAPQPAPTIVEKKTNPVPAVTAPVPTPAPAPTVVSPQPIGNADGSVARAFRAGPAPPPGTAIAQNPSVVTPSPNLVPPPHPAPPPFQNQAAVPEPEVGNNNHLVSAAPKIVAHTNAPPAASPATSAPANNEKPAAVATVVGRPKVLLIGALLTAAIGFGLIALLYYRSRTASGPSLITQMMSNPRKK